MAEETTQPVDPSVQNDLEVLERSQTPDGGCPIDNLPNELLELIFLEISKTTVTAEALDMQAFGWISGQVCRRWRQVILFLPQLWNELRMKLRRFSNKDGITVVSCGNRGWAMLSQYAAAIMEERLLRCRGSTLTINIEYLMKNDIPEITTLFAVIGAHSEQWKSVSFVIENESLAESLCNQAFSRHLPRLRHLEWSWLPLTLPNVVVAPSLRKLGAYGPSITSYFPWQKLKRVSLDAAEDHTLVDLRILQQSTNLQYLNLFNPFPRPVEHELRFNHVRNLSCCIPALDAFMQLPALELLRLAPSQSFTALPGFISRLSRSLKSLILPPMVNDQDPIIAMDVAIMLPDLPKLTLNLGCNHPTIALLKLLTVNPTRLEIFPLPNLKHLSLHNVHEDQMPRCIDLIGSRMPPLEYKLPRLESVEFDLVTPLKDLPEIYQRRIDMEKWRLTVKGLNFDL
ncbi:hypothetical protein C8J56DRAFT_284983 [Mycena floridula]|nr:hypothetical protein C8J56DRAFT_284983 [Mycena floridula]